MNNRQLARHLFLLALFLTPLLAFADHDQNDCRHYWKDSDCVVQMDQHGGVFETVTFFAITLGSFLLLTRRRAVGMNKG